MSLSERLAGTDRDELGRALAKAARVISRLGPEEELRGHTRRDDDDKMPRREIVSAVWEGNTAELEPLIQHLLQDDNGVRDLIRSLNNLRRVRTAQSMAFSNILLDSLEPHVSELDYARQVAKHLTGIELDSKGSTRALERAEELLNADLGEDPTDIRTWLLQELVALELRQGVFSDHLIEARASWRPKHLAAKTRQRLENEVQGDKPPHWSKRLAAIWLLANDSGRGYMLARQVLEQAYEDFPLEALGAVEEVNFATAYDSTQEEQA